MLRYYGGGPGTPLSLVVTLRLEIVLHKIPWKTTTSRFVQFNLTRYKILICELQRRWYADSLPLVRGRIAVNPFPGFMVN